MGNCNFTGQGEKEELNIRCYEEKGNSFSSRHKAERLMSFCRYDQIQARYHRYNICHIIDNIPSKNLLPQWLSRHAKSRVKQIPFFQAAGFRATLVSISLIWGGLYLVLCTLYYLFQLLNIYTSEK